MLAALGVGVANRWRERREADAPYPSPSDLQ